MNTPTIKVTRFHIGYRVLIMTEADVFMFNTCQEAADFISIHHPTEVTSWNI